MAIITRAQLRKWFGRGQYPTAEQFSDLFDSFWHKEEERIAAGRVEGLAEALNEKYAAADGQALDAAQAALTQAFERHRTEAVEAVAQLRTQLDELRAEVAAVKTDYLRKDDRIIIDGTV